MRRDVVDLLFLALIVAVVSWLLQRSRAVED